MMLPLADSQSTDKTCLVLFALCQLISILINVTSSEVPQATAHCNIDTAIQGLCERSQHIFHSLQDRLHLHKSRVHLRGDRYLYASAPPSWMNEEAREIPTSMRVVSASESPQQLLHVACAHTHTHTHGREQQIEHPVGTQADACQCLGPQLLCAEWSHLTVLYNSDHAFPQDQLQAIQKVRCTPACAQHI